MYNVNNTRQFQCFLIILITNNFMFEYHQHYLYQIRIRVFFRYICFAKKPVDFRITVSWTNSHGKKTGLNFKSLNESVRKYGLL